MGYGWWGEAVDGGPIWDHEEVREGLCGGAEDRYRSLLLVFALDARGIEGITT